MDRLNVGDYFNTPDIPNATFTVKSVSETAYIVTRRDGKGKFIRDVEYQIKSIHALFSINSTWSLMRYKPIFNDDLFIL